MNKLSMLGVVAGVCLTEMLQYFGPHSELLFYGYILFGAITATVISGRSRSGLIIAIYVILWKIVGMVFLMQAYGAKAVASSFLLFLLDWTVVVLFGIAGGTLGSALRKYIDRTWDENASLN